MSRFHGARRRGALAEYRKQLRADAVERNARTKPENRSAKRARKLTQNGGES